MNNEDLEEMLKETKKCPYESKMDYESYCIAGIKSCPMYDIKRISIPFKIKGHENKDGIIRFRGCNLYKLRK